MVVVCGMFCEKLRGDKESDLTDVQSILMSDASGQQALLLEGIVGMRWRKWMGILL